MSKLNTARDAIDDVFGDTSVSQSETRNQLEELSAHIESLLDSLPEDDE